MIDFLKIVNDKIKVVRNPNYREYIYLLFKYGNRKRGEAAELSFLNYNITAADCLSFIFQFKEIFVNEVYKFNTSSPSPLIYDCGANIGISVLYFKKLFPAAKVIAFEADPDIALILKNNLIRNSISGVEVIPKAVWINNSGVGFAPDGADGGLISENKKITVDSVRLKDLLEKEVKIDFLKIDIEGAETELITDCGESLQSAHRIFIEYHSWKDLPQKLDKLVSVLTENKFRYFISPVSELETPFNPDNAINETDLQLNIYAVKDKLL